MSEARLTARALRASAEAEAWRLAAPFIISRARYDELHVVVVTLDDGIHHGRGECCPVARYGETIESVLAAVEAMLDPLRRGGDWDALHDSFPAGAARNAVDCAIWDLRAKQTGRRAWELLGLPAPVPVETVFTISLDTPERMAEAARAAVSHGILKLKLGAADDAERLRAVRAAVPDKRLIVDVNEAWSAAEFAATISALVEARVEMLEQPFPEQADTILRDLEAPILIGADESCHVAADASRLADRYGIVNIKLDKTGGLTEAVRLQRAAAAAGLETMVGCMLGTSLAMAPALLLTPAARFVDLDGPLLIGRDRTPALAYRGGWLDPSSPELWG